MRNPTEAQHGGKLFCLLLIALMSALVLVPYLSKTGAAPEREKGLFPVTRSHEIEIENFDIRTADTREAEAEMLAYRTAGGVPAFAIADTRDRFVRGEAELRGRVPTLRVEYSPTLRSPEVIGTDAWRSSVDRLSGSSRLERAEVLRNFARENNELLGVSGGQIDRLEVLSDYMNPNGYLGFAHLQQRMNGIPVFAGEIKAGFTKNGEIVRVINNLAPAIEENSLSVNFGDPAAALRSAAGFIGSDLSDIDTRTDPARSTDLKTVFGTDEFADTAEKMYFPTEPGVARAAWRVLIWHPVRAYYVIVDAETGSMLWRKNITEDQTQSATYNVYGSPNAYMDAADSPAPLTPGPVDPGTGQQGALLTRSNRTLIGNEGPTSFNNEGWITDGMNVTDGNAVEAGLDRVSPNGVDAPFPGDGTCPGTGCRVFSSNWNPPPGDPPPGDGPLTPDSQRGAVIQMFYVMNLYHDILYQLGFTEQAFNFQDDNFGRGGSGADRVSAEGQDSSGTNNANFSTPADGGRGRMQMFLWTGVTPNRDGTADADVIIHEVTHGTSNRLHGNTAGLSGNMARGMGEGWGDFYGHAMLAESSDPINAIYTTGGYVTINIVSGFTGNYYYGIRRFPKAVMAFTGGPGNLPHNPLTFGNLNSANCGTFNSAFPRGPIGSATDCDQVHNAGEIWSSALWEVRGKMVQRLGSAAGTERVLQVVTDGMKLAPLNPTFLQERDAIIMAASALPVAPEASADVADVREGFRIRGMGFSAVVNNATTGDVTEAFDFPNIQVVDPFAVSDAPGDNDGFPEPGEDVTLNVSITNNTGASIDDIVVSVVGGGSDNVGTLADGATVVAELDYTVPGDVACGAMHEVTINAVSEVGSQTPETFSFRVGTPVGGAPMSFENTAPISIPSSGPATPYPSSIAVAGVTGNRAIRLQLAGLNSGFPDDVDFMVEGPGGETLIFLSDVGGSNDWVDETINLTDMAEGLASDSGPVPSGDYKPTNYGANDPFDPPAPAGPYGNAAPAGSDTFESVFGTSGSGFNGTWNLYIDDDLGGFDGSVTGGWKLIFESNEYLCDIGPSSGDGRADFDGDGRTDVSVFRPGDGNWYINQSADGFMAINWGIDGDVLTPADFDADGKTDTAIFRPGSTPESPDFYVLNSTAFTVSGVAWGVAGDIPAVADYDGDGNADFAVYRPSDETWYILRSSDGGNTITVNAGDTPVPADYDGDGSDDVVSFTDGTWSGTYSGGGTVDVSLGMAGDLPAAGDFDGDGSTDFAVFRPSNGTWYIRQSSDDTVVSVQFGAAGDVPVPGDYDGDGTDDVAVYRDGQWWVNGSTAGVSVVIFGLGTDAPIVASARP